MKVRSMRPLNNRWVILEALHPNASSLLVLRLHHSLNKPSKDLIGFILALYDSFCI